MWGMDPNAEPQDYVGVPQGQQLPTPQLQLGSIAPPQIPINPYASQSAPPGSLTATPSQYTAESLAGLAKQQDIAGAQGDVAMQEGQQLADKQNEAAQEKIQQSQDFQRLLQEHAQRHEEDHNRLLSAYGDYAAKAGSLKDPSSQFFEDKGAGARILSGFAAFASGMGAGLLGKATNPFLDYLNQQIEHNFEAHKQNIRDLYDKQVSAGKIQDTDQNWNTYLQESKLKSYELSSAHISNELAGIHANATGATQKLLAQKTQEDLAQQGLDMRAKLSQQQAAQAAAQLANQRATQKEIRTALATAIEKHNDLPEDEARLAAFKDVQALGYDRSALAGPASALGIKTDPKTGDFIVPTSTTPTGTGSEPTVNDNGEVIPPTLDANGKKLKPEQQTQIVDQYRKRLVSIDGNKFVADNEDQAKSLKEYASAEAEAKAANANLNKAWKEGNKGAYDQARNELIELAPKLYGFSRGPSAAQAGEGKEVPGQDVKATVAGQIPEFNLRAGVAGALGGALDPGIAKLQGVQQFSHAHPIITNSEVGQGAAKLQAFGEQLGRLGQQARANLKPIGTATSTSEAKLVKPSEVPDVR